MRIPGKLIALTTALLALFFANSAADAQEQAQRLSYQTQVESASLGIEALQPQGNRVPGPRKPDLAAKENGRAVERTDAAGITRATTIQEYAVPTAGSTPYAIDYNGYDGNLWFTEQNSNKIGRMTTAGIVTEFAIPTANSGPTGITLNENGGMWFTEQNGNKIGRITTDGVITEFPIPTANSGPTSIAIRYFGSDLWFTERDGNKIGRLSWNGHTFAEFPLPTAGSLPTSITRGTDGNLWFTEQGTNKIGQMSIAGVLLNEFAIPTANCQPNGLIQGPDGNLWFAETTGNKIARITTTGVITEFPLPTPNSSPQNIAGGPLSDLWFTEQGTHKIGRMATTGVLLDEFAIPTAGSQPQGITYHPNGNLWFTEASGNKIGQVRFLHDGLECSFILSDEGLGLIRIMKAQGYATYSLYDSLLELQTNSDPTITPVLSDRLLEVFASCPAASQIFTTKLQNLTPGSSTALNTDCTVKSLSILGATYKDQPGVANLSTAFDFPYLITHSSNPQTPLTTWQESPTTYDVIGIAWTPGSRVLLPCILR